MTSFRTLALAVVSFLMGVTAAAGQSTDSLTTIVQKIESGGIIIVEMPRGLAQKLAVGTQQSAETSPASDIAVDETRQVSDSLETNTEAPVAGTVKTAGYRVQVFSDNNARTAKSEARAKAQALQARLPKYRTYVVYQSPFWRLKVGDFPTLTEAENAADEIKKLFPAYAREVRVVKDRINR